MADLNLALPPVLAYEGGYVNDPADPGGETYMGISRRYHPNSGVWPIIDADRKDGRPINDAFLFGLVLSFYRLQFWDRFQGNAIPDQALADELLDQAVNLGVSRAVEHLQRALNALNSQAKRWPDLDRDGKLGPATLRAIESARTYGLLPHLLTALKCQQGCYYLERMEARPVNEKYAGWFARV